MYDIILNLRILITRIGVYIMQLALCTVPAYVLYVFNRVQKYLIQLPKWVCIAILMFMIIVLSTH